MRTTCCASADWIAANENCCCFTVSVRNLLAACASPNVSRLSGELRTPRWPLSDPTCACKSCSCCSRAAFSSCRGYSRSTVRELSRLRSVASGQRSALAYLAHVVRRLPLRARPVLRSRPLPLGAHNTLLSDETGRCELILRYCCTRSPARLLVLQVGHKVAERRELLGRRRRLHHQSVTRSAVAAGGVAQHGQQQLALLQHRRGAHSRAVLLVLLLEIFAVVRPRRRRSCSLVRWPAPTFGAVHQSAPRSVKFVSELARGWSRTRNNGRLIIAW